MSMPDSPVTLIKDIRPGLRQLTSDFIVLEIYPSTKTKEGKDVATVKVADVTGSINVVLYGDYVSALQPSDVLRMTSGYAVVNKGSMCLYMAKHGSLTKIGEFCFLFSEVPNMSDPSADFLSDYMQSQQPNGRGNSPPSFEGPPEPPPLLPNGPPGHPAFMAAGQQPRMPAAHYQPQQGPWQQQQQTQPPVPFQNMPAPDLTSRLQPPPFDLNGASARVSPPHSATSPPPTEQSSTGPRVIPSQSAFPPVSSAPPVSSLGPVDPRASRGGQNRFHPYQQPQQTQPPQQQRQPLQPIGSGPGGAKPAIQLQGAQSRSGSYGSGQQNMGSARSGPPVIPANPIVSFRQTPLQHPASVRR